MDLIYDLNKPWLTLDPWQKEYIETEGNCFLLCGRQAGKTAAMSIKVSECAIKEENPCDYLVVALTERQAYALFFKTLMYLEQRYPRMIKRGKDKPTMHEINLKNGVRIMCYAVGLKGEGIRTYTIKKLFVDEAAPMAREVFVAIMPMLSVTGGSIDMASTPRGKEGYFYECSKRDDFKKFYVSAEDCPRHKKEFLEAEKTRMTKLEYAQEYLAIFLDEFKRFFSDALLIQMKEKGLFIKRQEIINEHTFFLGVDVARMGEDECRFEIIDRIERDKLVHIDNICLKKVYLNEVTQEIIYLDKIYNFKRIYIDSGGIGVGVSDYLLSNEHMRKKIVEINNRSRPYEFKENPKAKKLLKEDLYYNLLGLMERGEISLLEDDDLIESLKSIQHEVVIVANIPTTEKIWGSYSHVVEALIRSCWCIKDKGLNIWCR